MTSRADPRASVIVCTLDRAPLLAQCLDALLADESMAGSELLVVDNGSRDDTAAVVAARRGVRPDVAVEYLVQRRPGKARALNLGVGAARAECLLFTDDDVLVEPGWAGALVAALGAPGIGAAGGRTLPRWPVPPPRWMEGQGAAALGHRDLGDAPCEAKPGDVVGASMAVRRAALAGLKPAFEETLGPVGRLKVAWEERHLLEVISRAHGIAFTPAATGHHLVDQGRMDWGFIRRLSFQTGFGKARHERLMGTRPPRLADGLRDAASQLLVARVLRRRNAALPDPGPADATAEFLAWDEAGRRLDMLLSRWPGLANRAAGWDV